MTFCALFAVGTILKTYALLQSTGTGKTSEDVGKWVIKLNGTDISSGIVNDFVIDDVTYTDNSNVANGYIAPGRSGYADITLDPSGTQVSVRYDITIDLASTNYASNIQFSVTDLSGGNAIMTSPNTYSGVISLAGISAGNTITLRININWLNDVNYNTNDTDLGTVKDNALTIPVTVRVVQYLGETITPYS